MAYNDRSNGQPGQYQYQPRYTDGPEFNPYNPPQRYPTYDQGGYDNSGGEYRDDDVDDNFSNPRIAPTAIPQAGPSGVAKERSGSIQRDYIPPIISPPREGIREWRHDYHGNLWTRGGRGSCIGRFCCCTLMTIIFLVITIVCTLALWARPPNILIGQAGLVTNGSPIALTENSLDIFLSVNITVDNPNYFGVNLKKISADFFYPLNGNKTAIGNGSESNVDFGSNSDKTFQFPFTVSYQENLDPNHAILIDIATKCFGTPKEDLNIDYQIDLAVEIVAVTVTVPISNSIDFECPLTESEVTSLLNSAGLSLSSILGGQIP